MTNTDDPSDDVIILAADISLLLKLGDVDLDMVLSSEAIQKAETIIASASNGLYIDCIKEAAKLKPIVDRLERGGRDTGQNLKKIISIAFGIKSKAGQSGYDLVSALAKSLQVRCEKLSAAQVPLTERKIIAWHVQSIGQLLAHDIKGDGGEAGKAILEELNRLKISA